MDKTEYGFNEARQTLDTSRARLERAVSAYEKANSEKRNDLGISEADYIRLTRVIQLVEKHLPKREIIAADQTAKTRRQALFMKVIAAYRNIDLKKSRKKSKGMEAEKFPSSYTIAEEVLRNLTELRHFDYLLRHLKGESEEELEKMLDQGPTGQIARERSEGPGILDDYRQGSWGIERICLDGMQNHLPRDAKGTACWLHFEIDGKWVSTDVAKASPEKITRVRFADDGVGFTPDNLLYLHSTKTSEKDSAGQFGEGMKLASMASINLGLGMELQSRNWSAYAIGEAKDLVNTRANDSIEKRKKLVYQIKEYDGDSLVGSRTIFHTPSQEFIDFALKLPEKVLALNAQYRPTFTTEHGDIVSALKSGQIFVKGIYVQQIKSLFSYNFDEADVNPDRNQVTGYNVNHAVENIILELNDIRVMKTLIAKMLDYYRENLNQSTYDLPLEMKFGESLYYQFRNGNGVPSLWREAFRQVLEQKGATNVDGKPIEAVLKTSYEIPEQLSDNLAKYNVVSLPKYWTLAMQTAGVKTDRETLPEYIDEIIPTSLSLEYGKELWGSERIVLDAVSNHLPADCGGSKLFLRFQTSDGSWHDFSHFSEFEDADIKQIKISDDGTGYDVRSLGLFASAKDHSKSTGKWGEGLKMLSAAALREGVKIVLRSRDWMARPITKTVILNEGEINQKEVQQLVYETITKINFGSEILNDGDNPSNGDHGYYQQYEKSSTTFIEPSADLIREFRMIKEKVLPLARKNAIAYLEDGTEVLDLSSGKLFIREILIPGNHQLKYGYHFSNFDIETRDRNAIKTQSLQNQLKNIFQRINDVRFISAFLKDAVAYAQGNRSVNYLEFTTPFTIPSGSYQADTWISVFKQDFGDMTSIRASGDQDMNAVHQAEHLGLDMVTLPDTVARALTGVKGKDGQAIPSYEKELTNAIDNVIPVPAEDLTEYEQYIIRHLLRYNEILALSGEAEPIKSINIYDYDSKYIGTKADGFAALGSTINIRRSVLNRDLRRAGDVFFHESGHGITGAVDAEARFRDFFTDLLSRVAMENIPIDQKELAALKEAASLGITREELRQLKEQIPSEELAFVDPAPDQFIDGLGI